jgi:CBS domain-containing protein
LNVDRVMTAPAVSCRPDESLAEVVDRMLERDLSWLPVVDASGRLVGALGHREIHRTALAAARPLDRIEARRALREPAWPWCWPNDTVEAAGAIMRARGVKRLPVVKPDGRLLGVVALADIAAALCGPRCSLRDAPALESAVETLAALAS